MADSKPVRGGRTRILTDSQRKKRRLETAQRYAITRIYIGDHISRWREFRKDKDLKSDADVAELLLDSYASYQELMAYRKTSTPHTAAGLERLRVPLAFPEKKSGSGSELSGIHPMELSESELSTGQATVKGQYQKQYLRRTKVQKTMSSSFLDPFSMSITTEGNSGSLSMTTEGDSGSLSMTTEGDSGSLSMTTEGDSGSLSMTTEGDSGSDLDEDYDPNLDIDDTCLSMPEELQEIQEVAFGDVEVGGEGGEEENDIGEKSDDSDEELGPGVKRAYDVEEATDITSDEAGIVYLQPLLHLAQKKVDTVCRVKGCKCPVEIHTSFVGSAIYLKWICSSNHIAYQWCSQTVLRRGLHVGDLLCSAAILTSGNNFGKIALFAKFLKLHFLSVSVYDRIQRCYLIPTIEQFWRDHQEEVLRQFRGQDVVVLGDGRMDSPGHCAKYCTYTGMENTTKKILSIVTIDKRQTDKRSSLMEKVGFIKLMSDLNEKNVTVCEVVTDAHPQIGAEMKRNHPEKKHSHDIWHAAKNLSKRVTAVGQEKSCKSLLEWVPHIKNHFWHVSQISNSRNEFIGYWSGLLHHVTNEHSWNLPYTRSTPAECSHGPLTEEQLDRSIWLKKGDASHTALRKIVLNKRLLNNIPYYINNRTTAELENFHQLILMYAAKRFAYSPPAYRARCYLAALDYNCHIGRPVKRKADGSAQQHRIHNKKGTRWTSYETKVSKTYPHIPQLMTEILKRRLTNRVGIQEKAVLSPGDPRRISSTIAPTEPPPTSILAAEKMSRKEAS